MAQARETATIQGNDSTVVNVKVGYIRPRFSDLRQWCADSSNEYIGRRGVVFVDKVRYPSRDSIWANPFKVGKGRTREVSIRKYEAHIRGRLAVDENLRSALRGLRGKALGCWCKPLACHGDVLLRLLQELDEDHAPRMGDKEHSAEALSRPPAAALRSGGDDGAGEPAAVASPQGVGAADTTHHRA